MHVMYTHGSDTNYYKSCIPSILGYFENDHHWWYELAMSVHINIAVMVWLLTATCMIIVSWSKIWTPNWLCLKYTWENNIRLLDYLDELYQCQYSIDNYFSLSSECKDAVMFFWTGPKWIQFHQTEAHSCKKLNYHFDNDQLIFIDELTCYIHWLNWLNN